MGQPQPIKSFEPDTQAKDMLSQARSDMVLNMPFFASLALRLYYKQRKDMPTAGVDGINFFYNPEFVKTLNHKQLLFLMMHESMHCALSHMTRCQERDPEKFNVACDYVINLIIHRYNQNEEMGNLISFPDGLLLDEKYDGFSAEEVYAQLPELTDEEKQAGAWGGVFPAPSEDDIENNPSQHTPQEIDQQWQIATKQAVRAAKAQGKLPGGLGDLLDEILSPKVNWQDKLRRFMTSHDKSGFAWQRPNRRFVHKNIHLPARWSQAVGEIVLAIDTSASVADAELLQFQGEINAILDEMAPKKVWVIDCDTEIHRVQTYTKEDLPLRMEVVGRGGTYFHPVFEYVFDNNIDPECLIYFTDLGADSNFTPPAYPVMWINTDPNQVHPAWGEVVDLVLNT
jgi:predicted metal-dependent peptidase